MDGSDVKNVCVYVYLRFPQPVLPIVQSDHYQDYQITISQLDISVLGSISSTLLLTIPDSREEFCTAEHQYSYSILISELPSVATTTRLQHN